MTVDHHTAASDFQALLRLRMKHLRNIPPDGQVSGKHARIYEQRLLEFKASCPGPGVRVAIFGHSGNGVFVTTERASFLVQEGQILFDWTDAQRLLHRADAIADQAAEWWPHEAMASSSSLRRGRSRRERNDSERRPHIDRAYNAMTAILSAIDRENRRIIKGREEGRDDDARSAAYLTSMRVVEQDIARAEILLDNAAQRQAQLGYTRGMLLGAFGLGLFCLAVGAALYATGTLALNGVALLAGGLGAFVSVLQRMTSGSLRLDVHAGSGMLFRFGMLRPVLGAIFGMAVFVLFAGGVLPAFSIEPSQELAFFAAVAFLAGFNERFAQDVIAGSTSRFATANDAGRPGKHKKVITEVRDVDPNRPGITSSPESTA